MDRSNILFYDIEVYPKESLVVFMDDDYNFWHFWNEDFGEPISELVEGKTLVGYNNHYYDNPILQAMRQGKTQTAIKEFNDTLIRNGSSYTLPQVAKTAKNEMRTLDAMQQIDLSRPSLKKIEGNMGESIRETTINFDTDKVFSPEERQEILEYCMHDVRMTKAVFDLREKSYFETKIELAKMFCEERWSDPDEIEKNLLKVIKWNTTTLSSNYLKDQQDPVDETPLPELIGDKWRNIEGIPEAVWSMWESVQLEPVEIDGSTILGLAKVKTKSIQRKLLGCTFVFGFGGLHGVSGKKCRNIKLLDVASMYPSIIVNLNGLGNATQKYDEMRRERVKIKKTDKLKSDTLKLVLNSVYGLMRSKYSTVYNPMGAVAVCVYGQMALFDLCRDLYGAGYAIRNANTDGVAFEDAMGIGNDSYKQIQADWESRWNLQLELDEFDFWYQKDVNNYVARVGSKVKVKGGEVNQYFEPKLFSNSNARIIHKALVEAILAEDKQDDDFSISGYIFEHRNELELFQYILKAGGTYSGTCDENGNLLETKVNRVFAHRKTEGDGSGKLYKLKPDGGRVNYPDMPECMYIWNDSIKAEDVENRDDFKLNLDLEHYNRIATNKFEAWKKRDD